ncbi:NADP-dependent oxidoreductase domain-containing protein [Pisolithus microcarpus]|nr:NADP-dependent oxidoreductase domain-containing protein [Pisolithus microcarpus]
MNTLKPKIIYGTAWKGERTAQLVMNAFLQGFRALDTACQPKHYREDLVGEALERLQAASMIFCAKSTTVQTKRSYLDSYLLHSPLRTMDATLEAWSALIAAQDAGTVHKIGISNVYDARVLVALGQLRKVQVVQNRWYEGNRLGPRSLAVKPRSFWTLTGSPSLLAHPAVVKASTKLDVTPAQVIFKLVQLHGIIPLTGTSSELHMQQGPRSGANQRSRAVEEEIRIITKFIWG